MKQVGGNSNKVRISDAYAVYKNKDGDGQQCWAHLYRKMRDLARSKSLSKSTLKHTQKAYIKFCLIYEKIRLYISELFEDIKQFRKFHKKDPKKLHNIKQQFIDYEKEFLICMDYDGIPCDNNKAERMLRHFLIKRKISFGSKSDKGAETFSTLASVFMTYWKRPGKDFFLQF